MLAGGQSLVPALNMRLAAPGGARRHQPRRRARRVVERGRPLASARPSAGGRAASRTPLLAAVPPARRPRRDPQPRHRRRLDRARRRRRPSCRSPRRARRSASVPPREAPRDRRRGVLRPPYTTALEPDEWWSRPSGRARRRAGFAFEELALRAGDYALCMAAARVPRRRRARRRRRGHARCPTLLEVDPERPGESAAAQVEPWGTSTHRPRTSGTSCACSSTASSSARGSERRDRVDVTVNGRRYREAVEPRLLLSDFLRHARPHRHARRLRARRLRRLHGAARRRRRALVPAARRPGRRRRVVTVEGLAGAGALTPLQEAFRATTRSSAASARPGS